MRRKVGSRGRHEHPPSWTPSVTLLPGHLCNPNQPSLTSCFQFCPFEFSHRRLFLRVIILSLGFSTNRFKKAVLLYLSYGVFLGSSTAAFGREETERSRLREKRRGRLMATSFNLKLMRDRLDGGFSVWRQKVTIPSI